VHIKLLMNCQVKISLSVSPPTADPNYVTTMKLMTVSEAHSHLHLTAEMTIDRYQTYCFAFVNVLLPSSFSLFHKAGS
jgi:hypothetical protein